MAAEKESAASLVNLCHLFMKEVGMPKMALRELLNRASAASTGLESLESVQIWKLVNEPFLLLEEKVAKGPFKPANNVVRKRAIVSVLDLNQPAPENEEPCELDLELKLFSGTAFGIMQDDATVVEIEAKASTTAGKRKVPRANYNLVQRMKFIEQSAGPANNEKGKGILEMEGSGSN